MASGSNDSDLSGSGQAKSRLSYLPAVLGSRNPNTVFYWVDVALQKIRDHQVPFPWSSYCLTMPMVAGFLAADAATGRGRSQTSGRTGPGLEEFGAGLGSDLAADLASAPADVDPQLAYAKAFSTVTEHLLDVSCQVSLERFIRKMSSRDSATEGVAWGEAVGHALLRSRSGDNSEPGLSGYNLGRYPRPHHPLRWEAVPRDQSVGSGLAPRTSVGGVFPGFGKIRLWTSTRKTPLRPDLFHNPASPDFAEDFDLLRSVGGAQSMVRTPDQTQSALFWSGVPGGVTISGHLLLVAMQVLHDRDFDFLDLARAFALIGMIQCDVAIQTWDAKYHFDIMRPETAIRCRGRATGNTDLRVVADKDWCSAIPAPEYPSYPSGHSAVAAAVVEVLRHLLQSDRISMMQTAPDADLLPGGVLPQQRWGSLRQMGEDCGKSRIFGGVNWLLDHERATHSACITARNALSRFWPL
ncbi:MAG: vanadium-dependent haloperoxidase [Pseudomonadota bacterium]